MEDIGGEFFIGPGAAWGHACPPDRSFAKPLNIVPITISLVEDNHQLRGTLARLIDGAEGFHCVSQYASAEDALAGLPKDKPEVVLMDINLPGINGVECVRQLKQAAPEIAVVMLTAYEDTENIFNALAAGATGYLLKRAPRAELLEAIREVHRGGSPMTTHIARKVVQSFQKTSARRADQRGPFRPRTGGAGLSQPGISLQGNRRKNGHQLRDRAYLHSADLREAPGPDAHRGGGEVSATVRCASYHSHRSKRGAIIRLGRYSATRTFFTSRMISATQKISRPSVALIASIKGQG